MSDPFAIAALAFVFLLVFVVSLNALERHPLFAGASRIWISVCVAGLSVIGIGRDVDGFLIPAAALGIAILIVLLLSVLFRFFSRKKVSQYEPHEKAKRSTTPNHLARTVRKQKLNRERISTR